MTLEQLRTLSRIVECGSLKQAAESLHKTQPALSMAIKKLEAEYGFEILNRESYRLSLTPAGRAFYRKAQELLLNADQLSSMGQHLGVGNEPLVRFAYDLTCPHSLILKVLKKCQQQFPDTELHVLGKSRFGALKLLQNGQADLVVSPWWPTLYALGDLDTQAISHFKIQLVAAPELFKAGEVQSTGQLKSQVHLMVEESGLSFDTESLMLIKGVRQWKTRDANTLKQMLLAGLGWGFIPEHMVQTELARGDLVRLQPEDLEYSIDGEIRLVRRQEHSLGPVASMLWQSFAEASMTTPV
ncbi:LysR family transcriptional regulator [Amphritea balenae]|uniref:LysR family transcriptional regulator n=1 Tax=Amphritea balenae TaxID=452629 RepID=A0A3P1SRX2_9GAMM|nr:LysR family transcriptional regulator [Amphritea balenae]RRC98932.1 LysR family transcriptional regulator [Amphritea balenae]GGK62991.1 LysR family transcriptional regulator [Amphritea balenae]